MKMKAIKYDLYESSDSYRELSTKISALYKSKDNIAKSLALLERFFILRLPRVFAMSHFSTF